MRRRTIAERTALLNTKPAPLMLQSEPRLIFTTDYSTDHQPRLVTVSALRWLRMRSAAAYRAGGAA